MSIVDYAFTKITIPMAHFDFSVFCPGYSRAGFYKNRQINLQIVFKLKHPSEQ